LKVREIEGKHDTLADQVRANTQGLLDRYTKIETNNLLKNYYTKQETRGMIANYTAVDGNTLKLNNEQITI
jgi:hypothetical protein